MSCVWIVAGPVFGAIVGAILAFIVVELQYR